MPSPRHQQQRQHIHRWRCEQQTIDPIQDAAVTGDQRTGVFQTSLALDERLGEIADRTDDPRRDADQRRRPERERQPEQCQCHKCASKRADHAASRALPRLARAE